jgi:hypothetical protein
MIFFSNHPQLTACSPFVVEARGRKVGQNRKLNKGLNMKGRIISCMELHNLTPVSCYHDTMSERIPPEVLEFLRKMGKAYGKLGGRKAAKNMTAAERSVRAKKAARAAAKKRTARRLAREGIKRKMKAAKRK